MGRWLTSTFTTATCCLCLGSIPPSSITARSAAPLAPKVTRTILSTTYRDILVHHHRDHHPWALRFYWKIVIDPAAGSGVAIVGVNNPHLKTIPDEYKICEPIPNHPLLENIYYPEDIVKGYMWACRYFSSNCLFGSP